MTSCVIVGAGIAGLLAGTVLQEAGWEVIVLDKGRSVGGRMSHRRLDDDG
ncbi:MAG: NAD(P)-binding protein, partial [Sphaerospermopsis sp. SIO1G2]|nr:NAD(P)-binding protein [Sphaerospermopsis sp. SIO1G2]